MPYTYIHEFTRTSTKEKLQRFINEKLNFIWVSDNMELDGDTQE